MNEYRKELSDFIQSNENKILALVIIMVVFKIPVLSLFIATIYYSSYSAQNIIEKIDQEQTDEVYEYWRKRNKISAVLQIISLITIMVSVTWNI
jgi:hypothetical protein